MYTGLHQERAYTCLGMYNAYTSPIFPPRAYMHFYCFVVYAPQNNLYKIIQDLFIVNCTRNTTYELRVSPTKTIENNRNACMHEEETIGLMYALWAGNT